MRRRPRRAPGREYEKGRGVVTHVLTVLYSRQMQQLPHAATPSPAPPVPLPALRIRQARATDAAAIGRLTAEVRMRKRGALCCNSTWRVSCSPGVRAAAAPSQRARPTHSGLAWSDGKRGLAWGMCTASHSHSHRKSALPLAAAVRSSSLQPRTKNLIRPSNTRSSPPPARRPAPTAPWSHLWLIICSPGPPTRGPTACGRGRRPRLALGWIRRLLNPPPSFTPAGRPAGRLGRRRSPPAPAVPPCW